MMLYVLHHVYFPRALDKASKTQGNFGLVAIPMMLIAKDEEALGGRCCEGSQALIDGAVAVSDFLQDHSHDDDIINAFMLQKVHLQVSSVSINLYFCKLPDHAKAVSFREGIRGREADVIGLASSSCHSIAQ